MNGNPNSTIEDLEIFQEYKEFFHEKMETAMTNSKVYQELKAKEKEKFMLDELCKFVVAEERKKIYVI